MKRIYGIILAGIILLNGVFIGDVSLASSSNSSYNSNNSSSSNNSNNNNNNSNGNNENNTSDKKESKPKVIIDNYTVTPNPIQAGQDFDLKISFQNTNKSRTVKNIKVVLNSEAKTETSDSGNNEGNTSNVSSGGTVFMPVGSSNTFYIDSIGAGKKTTKTIKMTTPYDVSPNTYELNVAIEYEDSNNEEYLVNESLAINLYQEAKVQVGTMPVLDGPLAESMPFAVDLYNTGKSTVYNMMVKLSGDFDTIGDSYYVGKFGPGETESFSAEIMAMESGAKEGVLTITYEDSTGQTHEVKQDFSANIIEMEPEIDESLDESKPFYKSPVFWIVLVLVIVLNGVAVYIILRKRKKNKELDEEDLEITDEDEESNIEEDLDLTQRIDLEEFIEQENLNKKEENQNEDSDVEDDEKNED